jgi:hypothetical protein
VAAGASPCNIPTGVTVRPPSPRLECSLVGRVPVADWSLLVTARDETESLGRVGRSACEV